MPGQDESGNSEAVRMLLGDYPATAALKDGRVGAAGLDLRFAPERVPQEAFKRFIREEAFDIGELAIVSYLQAKAMGYPLVLLPAVVLGRFNHAFIGYNSAFGELTPDMLAGRRVGVRSYSVTTGVWVRGILAEEYGVDLDAVEFVSFEDAHVPGYVPPDNVRPAPPGKTIVQMLLDGEIDAAIVGPDLYRHPGIRPLIADPEAAEKAWHRKHGIVPINHMIAAHEDFVRDNSGMVKTMLELLAKSRELAEGHGPDLLPMGEEVDRKALERIIRYAFQQKLIPQPVPVEDLFAWMENRL